MTTDEVRQIGARIAEARRAGGLTQQELAQRLGVTMRSIQNYEAGAVIPYRYLRKIESLAFKPPGWILEGGDGGELLRRMAAHQRAMKDHYALMQEHVKAMNQQLELLRRQREANQRRRAAEGESERSRGR